MKKILLLTGFLGILGPAFAKTDTTAYELQRRKINQLMDDRSAKFGQYAYSLEQRTGIFGLKTKKDMQHSINILTEIVQTDNHIFKELKILLDYKDLEKSLVENRAVNTEGHISNYKSTITKLQTQNQILNEKLQKREKQQTVHISMIAALALISLILGYLLFKAKKLT
ncbi:MAG TPA: hypothetical protein VEV16_04655 [Daejeonella sp.]|nr:hypothetical protein [Daejeonella sp.]